MAIHLFLHGIRNISENIQHLNDFLCPFLLYLSLFSLIIRIKPETINQKTKLALSIMSASLLVRMGCNEMLTRVIIDQSMWINKNDQMEQCFDGHELQELPSGEQESFSLDINKQINKHMPANELRTVRRPDTMTPRTFFLDRPLVLLPASLNRPCYESISPSDPGKLKLKIVNSKNLTLQQYFSKKKFRCVYNKLETYRSDSKTFLGKLKGIDSLIDYNWKFFKELESEQQEVLLKEDNIDSDFECGNLCRAYCSFEDEKEFYLLIENDLNTHGYNNWFFFKVRNQQKGVRRFTIVNLIKKTSFFSQGMLISIFSKTQNKMEECGWIKGGNKITFSSINFIRDHHANQYYSCLSFQYQFLHENDEVYFSLNQPYSYTRMVQFIGRTRESLTQNSAVMMEMKTIGYSISNNIIPTLRFTNKTQKNNVILILARQHPCETVGSFIAEGIIKELIRQSPISLHLLNEYEFVIVPMVNPDGVIHGVSRCNMSGLDLNRQWGENIIKELTPQTVKIKQFVMNLSKTKKIKYMIDLHGHGKKLNSFFFSCKGNQKENYRLFSMAMRKIEPRFNMSGCTYGISKDKQNTIRSRINSMGISHSYTLETSLYGWKDQTNQIKHMNQQDYQQIGKSLLESIFLVQADPALTLSYLGINRDMLIIEMASIIDVIEKQETVNMDNKEILSDSDPEGDKLDVKELLGKCQNKIIKKKIQDNLDKPKKPKSKRSKNFSKAERVESGRFSSKNMNMNMRETCPSNLEYAGKMLASNPPLMNSKDFFQRSLRSGSNSKKASFTQKWQERRQKIVEKKRTEQQQKDLIKEKQLLKEKQLKQMDSMNQTRTSLRSRIKTQVSTFATDKKMASITPLPSKIIFPKKKIFNPKMKTEFRQTEEISMQSEDNRECDERKSALELRQIKFKELQQESNVLLTDTLSILKIMPGDKEKIQLFPSPPAKSTKTISIQARNEHLQTEPSLKNCSRPQTRQHRQQREEDSAKYKKFKQFLTNGVSSKKMSKNQNSVFYYFPIL